MATTVVMNSIPAVINVRRVNLFRTPINLAMTTFDDSDGLLISSTAIPGPMILLKQLGNHRQTSGIPKTANLQDKIYGMNMVGSIRRGLTQEEEGNIETDTRGVMPWHWIQFSWMLQQPDSFPKPNVPKRSFEISLSLGTIPENLLISRDGFFSVR